MRRPRDGEARRPRPAIRRRLLVALSLLIAAGASTVRLGLPWRPAKAGEAAPAPELVPGVGPPANAVSSVRGSLSHVDDGGGPRLDSSPLLRGRALDGAWRFWWEDSAAGLSLLQEAAWYRAWVRSMALAGEQAVQTSPSLDSLELAGAQYGWSSVRRGAATGFSEGQRLTTRQATAIRAFSGSARPTSVVALTLDGSRVAVQRVGYSGEDELVDVEVPSRGTIVVEPEVHQRQNLTVPIEVGRQPSAASAPLLADGATTMATGGGMTGQFTNGLVGSSPGEPSHPGGYFYVRHDLTDSAIAEASLEALGSHVEGSAGLLAQLSQFFLLQAALVGGGGEVGHDGSLSGPADTTLVVEVVWDTRVLGVLEALDTPTGLSLPLLDLCELLQVPVLEREQDFLLSTPLGSATVPKDRLSWSDGAPFIDEGVLRELLAIELRLDRATLTLRLDVPWRPARAGEAVPGPELVPEVGPPANAVSSVRGSLSYVNEGGGSRLDSSLLLRGRALDGAWRFWWEDSTAGPALVREAAWYRAWGRNMVLAGKQAVQTSPLLDSFDLAGVQYGWSSVTRRGAAGYFEGQQLTTRQATPFRTFRGSAPPASVVVLKLDGARVAVQQVGYSGEYEFVDVALPSLGLIAVEIEIYQRQNLTVPIEVRRQLSAASALLLADGATTVATGGGLAGRFTSGFAESSSGEPTHAGGYLYVRHGLTDAATTEASVETIGSHVEGSAGIVAQLSRPFLLQTSLVGGGGEVGYDASLSGSFERGIVSLRSQSQPAGLTFYGPPADRWDHIAEGFYRLIPGLDLGLIARRINDGVEEADFVRPTVRWRPFSRLSLSAFPDTYGDYQANLFAQPGRNVWLAVNYAETVDAELTVGVAPNLQAGVTAEAGGGLDERYTAYLGGSWARFPGLMFKAGAITSGGRSGGLLSVNAPIGYGLLGALDYQAVPSRLSGQAFSQPRFSISVIADLAVAGRGLVPASASGMVRGSGAVAGRLRLAEGLSLPGVSLADVTVLVDGRARGMTGAQGTYFIGYLPEGVHTVEIDVGNLPIALVPVKSLRVARVVSGGVTRVDFELRVEFGLAGRVRDAIGTPLAGVRVELVTPSGEIVGRGRTDTFGLYRIDGVAPGHYVARLSKDSVPAGVVAPSREITIVDDFLFDQDLTVPVAVAPPPAEQEQPE